MNLLQRPWVQNALHGAWKGSLAMLAWLITSGIVHDALAHCSSEICVILGSPAFASVWSALAGVGVKQQG